MGYYLQYCLVMILAKALGLLPDSAVLAIVRFWARVFYFLLRRRRRIAFENLQKAYGAALPEKEKARIVQASFQAAALSLAELFLVEKILPSAERRFKISGLDHLKEAFARGKGVIIAISHLGSWEYLSFLCHLTKEPWFAVVKTVKNPYLDRKIDRLRRLMGVIPIPKRGSMKIILKELYQNHGVAILIDQWAGAEGLWQDFFGHPTSTTSIPARLALKTGCMILPAYCLRTAGGDYEIQLHAPLGDVLDEIETTRRLNRLLENQILRYPEQWLWAHRRWKPKP